MASFSSSTFVAAAPPLRRQYQICFFDFLPVVSEQKLGREKAAPVCARIVQSRSGKSNTSAASSSCAPLRLAIDATTETAVARFAGNRTAPVYRAVSSSPDCVTRGKENTTVRHILHAESLILSICLIGHRLYLVPRQLAVFVLVKRRAEREEFDIQTGAFSQLSFFTLPNVTCFYIAWIDCNTGAKRGPPRETARTS